MKARRAALPFHVWGGVIFGIFWAVQGLTGATLAFNRDVQVMSLASHSNAPRLPLDTVIARATKVLAAPVTRLETFGPDPNLLLAYYGGDKVGVIDIRSAALLDRRDQEAGLPSGGGTWGWLLRVHEALLAGDSGQVVVGTSGVLLLSTLLIGLWNILPYRRWRDAWRMTQLRAPRARFVGWHRLIGFLAAPALLVMAICGVYLAFAPQLRTILADTAGYRVAYKPTPQTGAPIVIVTAEHAYMIARQRFPGATLVRLVLPTAKSPVYLFRLLQPGDARRWAGTSTIAIDPRNGAVIDAYDSRSAPLANRITDEIYSIHTGDIAGPLGRALILLAGLALPFFAITGWISWTRGRRFAGRVR